MDKIIGFSLTYGATPPKPPWLADYPWLSTIRYVYQNGFQLRLWGHGNMLELVSDKIIVGQDSRYDMNPLDSTGVVLEKAPDGIRVKGNLFKSPPVFYGSKDGTPYISTCEECVLQGLGGATIGKGRLVSFLMHQGTTATLTLWDEIDQMDANSDLTVRLDGSFGLKWRDPMEFPKVEPDGYIDMLTEVIRSYTEPLGDIHLAMTSGYDSRLIMVLTDRPERIQTWSLPLGKPWERNAEYLWAARSAELWGVTSHMVELPDGLAPYMKPFVEYCGATASAMTAFTFAIMSYAKPRLPMLTGIMGDTVAGGGYDDLEERMVAYMGLDEQAVSICRDHGDMRWTDAQLDAALDFDWRLEFEKVKPQLAQAWQTTEGPSFQSRAALFRVRNRTSSILRPVTNSADLWGGAVAPYADRRYAAWMLALPDGLRRARRLVIETTTTRWPQIFNRPSGLTDESYDSHNTLDEDVASAETTWPLGFTHDLFKTERVKEISEGAAAVDMPSVRLSWALQPIAWAVKNGYAK